MARKYPTDPISCGGRAPWSVGVTIAGTIGASDPLPNFAVEAASLEFGTVDMALAD